MRISVYCFFPLERADMRPSHVFSGIPSFFLGKQLTIDSRPSDVIAIAVGADVPIYVTDEVLDKANTIELDKDTDEDQLKEFLESLNPEDFKYKA
jgi:hypothetical protein